VCPYENPVGVVARLSYVGGTFECPHAAVMISGCRVGSQSHMARRKYEVIIVRDELTSARLSLGVRSTREKGFICRSSTLRPWLHVKQKSRAVARKTA